MASAICVLMIAFLHLFFSGVNWPGCPGIERASPESGEAVCPVLKQVSWEAGRPVGCGVGCSYEIVGRGVDQKLVYKVTGETAGLATIPGG